MQTDTIQNLILEVKELQAEVDVEVKSVLLKQARIERLTKLANSMIDNGKLCNLDRLHQLIV